MHHSNPPPTFPSNPPDPNSDSDPESSPSPLRPPPPAIDTTTTTSTTMSDIFSTNPSPPSSPTSHNPNPTATATTTAADEPSDIPRLRSTHATAGYRNGIAASKERTIQAGFDEGYALGATVAMRAGWVLGVLEGVRDALVAGKQGVHGGGRGAGELKIGGGDEGKEKARRAEKILADARAELSVQELFGERYWGVDGVWRFEVVGGGEEGEVTFLEVAEQHPVIRKWVDVVERGAERWGVDLRGFEGEEWERGRVGDEVVVGLQG